MHNIPDANAIQVDDLYIICGYPVTKQKFDQYIKDYENLGFKLVDVLELLDKNNYQYIINKCNDNNGSVHIGSEKWMLCGEYDEQNVMLLCVICDGSEEDGNYQYYYWQKEKIYFKQLNKNNKLDGWCTFISFNIVTLQAYVQDGKITKGFNITDYLEDEFKQKIKNDIV